MDHVINWIVEHASYAHWLVFSGALLAGLNIPVSIDLMLVASAMLAARVVPENLWLLYFSTFFGCLFSAHIAYWLGRTAGRQLLRWNYFAKIFPQTRIDKIQKFYEKYGLFTLIVGRFIPFGIRNSIFMSSGMAKVPFLRFAMRDLIACFIWTSLCFTCFYLLGQSYETIKQFLKSFYLLLLV
jgi:membrane-associated protein